MSSGAYFKSKAPLAGGIVVGSTSVSTRNRITDLLMYRLGCAGTSLLTPTCDRRSYEQCRQQAVAG